VRHRIPWRASCERHIDRQDQFINRHRAALVGVRRRTLGRALESEVHHHDELADIDFVVTIAIANAIRLDWSHRQSAHCYAKSERNEDWSTP
jgi:hypothetical protein